VDHPEPDPDHRRTTPVGGQTGFIASAAVRGVP
jgi:hypothetical protein